MWFDLSCNTYVVGGLGFGCGRWSGYAYPLGLAIKEVNMQIATIIQMLTKGLINAYLSPDHKSLQPLPKTL